MKNMSVNVLKSDIFFQNKCIFNFLFRLKRLSLHMDK